MKTSRMTCLKAKTVQCKFQTFTESVSSMKDKNPRNKSLALLKPIKTAISSSTMPNQSHKGKALWTFRFWEKALVSNSQRI